MVERGVGVALQGFDIQAVGGIERDADAGAAIEVLPVDREGFAQGIDQPLREQVDAGQAGIALQDQVELAAADARWR